MTRTYAAKRLLEHGALNFKEFIEITGWTERQCRKTIERLLGKGIIKQAGYMRIPGTVRHGYVLWELA